MSGKKLRDALKVFAVAGGITAVSASGAIAGGGCGEGWNDCGEGSDKSTTIVVPITSSNSNSNSNADADARAAAAAKAASDARAAAEQKQQQKQNTTVDSTVNSTVDNKVDNTLDATTGDNTVKNQVIVDDNSKTKFGAAGQAPAMDIGDQVDQCASSESVTGAFWLVFTGGVSGGHSVVNAAGVTFPDGTKLTEYLNGTKEVRAAALKSANFSSEDLRALGCVEKMLVVEDSKHDNKLIDTMVNYKLGLDNNGNRDLNIPVTKLGQFSVEGVVSTEVPEYKEGMVLSTGALKRLMEKDPSIKIENISEMDYLLELFKEEEPENDVKQAPAALEM